MVYLIYQLARNVVQVIGGSRYFGPDGGIYDLFVTILYLFGQLYVFLDSDFLKKLPKRSPMGIVAMVLIFLPGIIVLDICNKVSTLFKAVRWKIKVRKRERRRHERKRILSNK